MARRKRSSKLQKAREKYPLVEFWEEKGKVIVLGSAPGLNWKHQRGAVLEQVRKFSTDPEFYVRPPLPPGATTYRPVSFKPTTPSSKPVVKRPVSKPSSGSAWPLPGANAQVPAPVEPTQPSVTTKAHKKIIPAMPQKRRARKGKPTARSRRYRIHNAALRPFRRPFKQVFPIALSAGYTDVEFTISKLVPELLAVYEEIRITSLRVVFLTKDVSVTAGLYTAILLDQNGYGNALKSTETWFKRVSDMPGSVVHHATRGFALTWQATEPDSRNYIKVIDTTEIHKAIARVYIIAQETSLSISGVLLVRGHCLCRGQYYDAAKVTTAMLRDLRIAELEDEDRVAASTPDAASEASFEMPVVVAERIQ